MTGTLHATDERERKECRREGGGEEMKHNKLKGKKRSICSDWMEINLLYDHTRRHFIKLSGITLSHCLSVVLLSAPALIVARQQGEMKKDTCSYSVKGAMCSIWHSKNEDHISHEPHCSLQRWH